MIPRLSLSESTPKFVQNFLEVLSKSEFSGDIHRDNGSRLVTATDNSIYQVLPQAVVFPKKSKDIQTVLKIADQKRFSKRIKITARGGGTGTNGQSLTEGIVLDCSRYMNRIIESNFKEGWVCVEPGVVLDQLNEHLAPNKVFFAPDLSPSNRATLGGMVNTDACGKGSRIYGRTSDHVLELTCVLSNGEVLESIPLEPEALSEYKKNLEYLPTFSRLLIKLFQRKQILFKKFFQK